MSARRWRGGPANVAEHSQLRWCALDEAQALLRAAHPHFARVLALAVEASALDG